MEWSLPFGPWWWLLLGLSVSLGASGAEPEAVQGDARRGERTSREELCQECHGEDGNSESVTTPKLAGMPAAYIVKQLHDFRFGARKHVVMTVMAADLDEQQRQDIAVYFSRLPRRRDPEGRASERGRRLFIDGDVTRGVPQCSGCHGQAGEGRTLAGVSAPALRWQHRVYLRIQLVAWRLGERSNSAGGVMTRVAETLNDEDVDELVAFLANGDGGGEGEGEGVKPAD